MLSEIILVWIFQLVNKKDIVDKVTKNYLGRVGSKILIFWLGFACDTHFSHTINSWFFLDSEIEIGTM